MKNQRIATLILFLGATLLILATPAAADPPTVIGSWETTTVNGHGKENVIYETLHYGGTALASGNTRESGGGHGAWKKIGPRTFAVTYVILIFDQTGALQFKVFTNNVREVSLDGMTATGVSESEVRTPDGILVFKQSKSFTSRRITP